METPFNSLGSIGLRAGSEPPTPFLSKLATPTVDLTVLSSPGARPVGIPGLGLGVGVGDGLALGFALENGPMLVAPVKNDNAAVESTAADGVSREETSVGAAALPPPG